MNGSLVELSSDERAEVIAKAFWALGNPVRMRIVETLIEEEEITVGDLAKRLGVGQPQISVQLGCLTDCGFTTVRREGRKAFYRISSPWVIGVISLMRDHAEKYCDDLLACAGCTPRARLNA